MTESHSICKLVLQYQYEYDIAIVMDGHSFSSTSCLYLHEYHKHDIPIDMGNTYTNA